MKKKICMLTLAVALSATALVGCSSNKDAEQTEYEGETDTPEDLEVIPENAADDAEGGAEDTETTEGTEGAEDTETTEDTEAADEGEAEDANLEENAEDANAAE